MRLTERIKIDDKEYTVRELTVEEIINLFSSQPSSNDSNPTERSIEKKVENVIGDFFDGGGYLSTFLKLAMPGTTLGDLIKLAPSELMQIWEKVKEVNKYFFDLAQTLELGKQLTKAGRELLENFSQLAVSLSKRVMEKEYLDMDIPS